MRHAAASRLDEPQRGRATASASCDAVCSVWPELASVSRVACATLAMATLTCSTAVACCLVQSSISRAASVVVADEAGDLLERRRPRRRTGAAPASTAFEPLSVAITVVLTAARTSSMSVADLLGRAADAVGELADLVGDHGEALARLAGAGGLDASR